MLWRSFEHETYADSRVSSLADLSVDDSSRPSHPTLIMIPGVGSSLQNQKTLSRRKIYMPRFAASSPGGGMGPAWLDVVTLLCVAVSGDNELDLNSVFRTPLWPPVRRPEGTSSEHSLEQNGGHVRELAPDIRAPQKAGAIGGEPGRENVLVRVEGRVECPRRRREVRRSRPTAHDHLRPPAAPPRPDAFFESDAGDPELGPRSLTFICG